jgi:hypothetical protein
MKTRKLSNHVPTSTTKVVPRITMGYLTVKVRKEASAVLGGGVNKVHQRRRE